MGNPIVSIVSPCYNVSKKIQPYLKSLLDQTYRPLEVVLVDDGSTDNTLQILKSFQKKYDTNDFRIKCISQENKGPGGAVNTAIKHCSGEYLTWPDSDDWLANDSIKERIEFLESHPEYAIVTSNAAVYDSSDRLHPQNLLVEEVTKDIRSEDQFELTLHYRSIFCPGCHMVRMRDFLEAIPDREIYESRFGQNFQMLLPIYYHRKRYFLNKPLYNYVIYSNSLSHNISDLKTQLEHYDGYVDIIEQTLKRIPMSDDERIYWMNIVQKDDTIKRFCTAIAYHDKTIAKHYYQLLKRDNSLKFKFFLQYYALCLPPLRFIYKSIRFLYQILKK